MQLSFHLVLCALGAQSVFSLEPGLSVASLLNGQAVLTESVQGFLLLGHGSQVFCNCVFSVVACQFSQIFGGFFPMYQIVLFLHSLYFGIVCCGCCVLERVQGQTGLGDSFLHATLCG